MRAVLRPLITIPLMIAAVAPASAQAPAGKRLPSSGDLVYRLRSVSDPQLAPGGDWVAYTITTVDSAKDTRDADIWMTSWDGTQTVRLTSSAESETSPRWSPDGRSLAFLSGRQDGKGDQVWVLDRRGGEAQRLTTIKGGVDAMQWSPDSKRLVLVATVDLDTAKTDTTRKQPIVIDRYLFKDDGAGYLTTKRSHLLLFDVATRKVDTLTTGPADDDSPQWSPDGGRIAFVRTPVPEPGTGSQSDVYVVDARAGATPKALTSLPGPDVGPLAWSPDGGWVAFFRTDDPKYYAYQQRALAIVKSDGSAPARVLTAAFDRPLEAPTFTADGRSILAVAVDDRAQVMVRVSIADGRVERLDHERHVVLEYSAGAVAGTHMAALVSTPDRPPEVFASEGGPLRQLTHVNDSLVATLTFGATEDFASKSSDGTDVHSVLVRPAGAAAGAPLPLILFIHGGPDAQSNYAFNSTAQLFAARGFATLAVNYRGSNGRGLAYQRAIFADWGNKEVVDLLGAVDQAVHERIADPERLGIGGWSYGGILTDYTIATTPRFKAAISGAGSALQLSMYGTDEYITQYELELGPPWRSRELWIKLSYPFFSADRIKTPTLFMGGDVDFNVPILGGQQMYQALRELGVPTELVIYPNQHHGLSVPSFLKDRLDRYVGWYERYLKQTPAIGARR
ncbi:MAG TPA: S9 family peptidase [Gemmatimonadales bacterium]|nr:S9 family peptidase [Gemmatimonadales bacterium]